MTVWALANQETCRHIFDRTLLAFRGGPRELIGATSRAGPVWPEPVLSVLRIRAFHLRTDKSGRSVVSNGKRPKVRQIPEGPFRDFLKLVVAK